MEAKTNESSAAEAASTGQLLRRYRKLAGLTAQELAHEVNSKHPDDAITAAVVFNIEAERKTAITIPELAHFAEVLAISSLSRSLKPSVTLQCSDVMVPPKTKTAGCNRRFRSAASSRILSGLQWPENNDTRSASIRKNS